MSKYQSIVKKVQDVILKVNAEDVLRDAQSYGLKVSELDDFTNQAHDYAYIEKLSIKYAENAVKLCALGGFSSGFGGVVATITFSSADIANMAAQLYRLNQKLALLNGFDPSSELHNESMQTKFMTALGIDALAQAGIRTLVTKAASENLLKKGAASSPAVRLIMEIVKILGPKITKVQAGKLVPVLGGVIGGGVNYIFAKSVTKKLLADYKSDYFDRWQVQNR
ncbi:MAG: EcsC family protein [Novosphingobium sp.]|nr:EcsC family protein [Novosphingobium sp.]